MPKAKKQRGRRGGQSRALEEDELDVHPSKRVKSAEEDGASFHGDQASEDSFNDRSATYRGPLEAPFYGLLDEQEQSYFKQADSMLELDQFESQEERSLFVANVYREASGKELKMVNSQSCSRLMERLIHMSGADELKALFQKLRGHFLYLVTHRFASHCCETLFLKAAPLVTKELLAPSEEASGDAVSGNEAVPAERLFLDTLQELQGSLGYLLADQFASHAVRVLLIVLSGRPLRTSASSSVLQSKKKERIEIGAQVVKPSDELLSRRTVPSSFTQALGEMMASTTSGLDANHLRALATHQTAGPVLQLLLEIEFSSEGKRKAKDANSLFRRLVPDEVPAEGTPSASFIRGLLYDAVGSRLLEAIVAFAPSGVFKALYNTIFHDNLVNLARNDIASYVVIRILERLGRDDLEHAVHQICPQISVLVERSRTSCLKVLIERSRVRQLDTGMIADAMLAAYGAESPQRLLRMLQLDPMESQRMPHQIDATNNERLHGSLLAQAMLAEAGRLREEIMAALLAVDVLALLQIAKDRFATHVLQTALTCSGQAKPFRQKMTLRFVGHLMELAIDAVGSRVVDIFWTTTTDLPFVRERIARELLVNEAAIKESFYGRTVFRNWKIDLFKRKKSDWIAASRGRSASGPSLVETKTAIALARERFEASKGKRLHSQAGMKTNPAMKPRRYPGHHSTPKS